MAILKCKNVLLKTLTTSTQMTKELCKGNYIICADINSQTRGIITQDILYYDKKNNRVRFMLGEHWEENYLVVYPVTGVIAKNKNLKYFLNKAKVSGNFNINNYDLICMAEPKYIKVINDDFKDISNIFGESTLKKYSE